MKTIFATITAFVLALAVTGTVFARGPFGGGPGNCCQGGVQPEQIRKFQQDTLDLRQEMMTKSFELQRENLKATPDSAKIAALQTEIGAIQTKIQDARAQSGLPERGGRGPMGGGYGRGPMGMGGCNGQPCFGPQAQ